MNMYHLLINNNTNAIKIKSRTRAASKFVFDCCSVPKQVLSFIQILQDAVSHSLSSVAYKTVGLLLSHLIT
jgi:hypothetical protein